MENSRMQSCSRCGSLNIGFDSLDCAYVCIDCGHSGRKVGNITDERNPALDQQRQQKALEYWNSESS